MSPSAATASIPKSLLRVGNGLAVWACDVFPEIGNGDALESPLAGETPAVVAARHVALH